MVFIVITKLEGFIEKTNTIKEQKKQINKGMKPQENEVLKGKQSELDTYLKQIRALNSKIIITKAELNKDDNFKRMVESEDQAKENYRQLQILLDENMQLKKIHGG